MPLTLVAAGRAVAAVTGAAAARSGLRGRAGCRLRWTAAKTAEPAGPVLAGGATPDGQGEALPGLAIGLRLVAGPAARAGLGGAPAAGGTGLSGIVSLGAWEPLIAPCAAVPDAASARGVLGAAGWQPGVVGRPGIAAPAGRGHRVVLLRPAGLRRGGLVLPGAMAVPPGGVAVGRTVGDGFAGQVRRRAAACGDRLLRHRRPRVAPATGTRSFAREGVAAGIGRAVLLGILAGIGVL